MPVNPEQKSSVVSGFQGGIATDNTTGTAPAIELQHKPAQIAGFGHGTPQAIPPTLKAGAAPQGSPWANPSAAIKSTASNVTRNAYLQHSTVASRVPAHFRIWSGTIQPFTRPYCFADHNSMETRQKYQNKCKLQLGKASS
ncbi:hypothetical protein KC360_g2010 [Hortaea werneckii]|nr:hypothetical protein KC325_g3139 [Hortaea werneckii]KAI6995640.1 hypothetical protein KC359_g3956 [Hortaea werneckii]KAI7146436.1 hypothetical protein KC344_g3644 [Hortaea werneckii]KAI7177848.1 hypothetical protein KC360_g2010 [Hortaea werneckii]